MVRPFSMLRRPTRTGPHQTAATANNGTRASHSMTEVSVQTSVGDLATLLGLLPSSPTLSSPTFPASLSSSAALLRAAIWRSTIVRWAVCRSWAGLTGIPIKPVDPAVATLRANAIITERVQFACLYGVRKSALVDCARLDRRASPR
jgi:hypothetical protein